MKIFIECGLTRTFEMCKMPRVEWQERDIGYLKDEFEEDGVVQDTLA